ncbi:hypothetical protein HMPREF1250_1930 [Megasphaera vaginalis (ex Srinivasan et al. 2021)]|uniref:Uncharacterized protein n=1 Tax=Megasphaera vaginalis (ex Srinivasan et al. 2021) TaxID=1111454 RepID=U7UU87_9FIRM|nr:hypothetical protein HMPREF1250_1930 [Megasphaera vaginalis (ex Srinivasan et al. 2021)]
MNIRGFSVCLIKQKTDDSRIFQKAPCQIAAEKLFYLYDAEQIRSHRH